jgi:hypothetical protein
MHRILLPLLALTLLTAAYASPISELDRFTPRNNFELSGQLEPRPGTTSQDLEIAISGSVFGSLTAFIDFSLVDGLLRYLDKHVMATFQDASRYSLAGALKPPKGVSGN